MPINYTQMSLLYALQEALQLTSHHAEQQKHTHWDPKNSELCLVRLNSKETLMEKRSDSEVNIDRHTSSADLQSEQPLVDKIM
jgi:hypothetical protein